jgi:membrane-bound ClpP family serine protease
MSGVIILILLGIILFLIEFLIIPGTTVAGIGGLILMAGGVYLAFDNFGNQTGFIVLVGTFTVSVIILVIALRANTWKRIMLNTNVDSKVYEDADSDSIKPGDVGITMTRLAPIGKVKVNNISVEAKSISGYIDPHIEITVVKLSGSQLIVKLKNE